MHITQFFTFAVTYISFKSIYIYIIPSGLLWGSVTIPVMSFDEVAIAK